jgi:hypothetical protein
VLFLFSKRTGQHLVEVYKVYYKASKKTDNKRRLSFSFWQGWLFYSSILSALCGIFLAMDGNNPLFIHYNRALARLFWNSAEIPASVEPFRDFIWGPLGGTMACCYILLAYIARFPFGKKELWARNAIIAGFSAWVVLDSVLCLSYGVYFQVYIINAFSVLVKALPLIFTWREFKNKNREVKDPPLFPFFKN